MKQIRFFILAASVMAGFSLGTNRSLAVLPPTHYTNVEQVLNISITGSYVATAVVTNANPSKTVTNQTINTLAVTTANVIKAIATDTDTNFLNGQLLHKIPLNPPGTDSIVLRKGTNETDVTAVFGGSLGNNFWTTGNTNDFVKTALETPAGVTTNVTDSLNSLALNTANLSFIVTNGYGTAFYFSRVFRAGTNLTTNIWANISCGGGGTFTANGKFIAKLLSTNMSGPAQISFSTTSGSVIIK